MIKDAAEKALLNFLFAYILFSFLPYAAVLLFV